MVLQYLDNFLFCSGVGMFESMLEPYLKNSTAMATQFEVAMVFLLFGGCYMLFTPLVGFVRSHCFTTFLNPIKYCISR